MMNEWQTFDGTEANTLPARVAADTVKNIAPSALRGRKMREHTLRWRFVNNRAVTVPP